ncbi:MAG: NAD(P)-dependent oxidoreductase [Roseiflexaceae bacterium]
MRILVAGASGGVGQAVVTMANAWGYEVFALSRKPIHQPVWRHLQVDILNEAALFAAMASDIDVVISCIGMQRRNPQNPWSPSLSPINLTSMATRSMCRCMKMCGVSRIIALSAAGVAESAVGLNFVMKTMLATTMIGTAYTDLAHMELVLAHSGLDWLAPRPTRLVDGVPTSRVRVTDRFAVNDSIRRFDVACWIIDAINQPTWPPAEWGSRTPQITGD